MTVVLAGARLLGPMLVSPAVGTWLLTAPLDRTVLVRGRLVGYVGSSPPWSAPGSPRLGATLSAYPPDVIGWLTVLAAVALRPAGRRRDRRPGPRGRAPVRLLDLGARRRSSGSAWCWSRATPCRPCCGCRPSPPSALAPSSSPACPPSCCSCVAYRSLRLIRRERLVSGGALLPGLSGALASLDLTLFYDILVARHWRSRSTVRVVRGRGTGASALVWREVVRLRRTPQVLVGLAGALVLPYLATALGLGHVMVVVVTLTGFVAGVGLFTSLRVLSRTASLLRCFPLPAPAVRIACLGVPSAVLLVWVARHDPGGARRHRRDRGARARSSRSRAGRPSRPRPSAG